MNYSKLISQVFLIVILALATAWSARAAKSNDPEFKFAAPRTYTDGEVLDYTKDAPADALKGALVLVWQKNPEVQHHQIEIYRADNPASKMTFESDRHLFHVMLYFDKEYLWRARYLDENKKPLSEFSAESHVKVVRSLSDDAKPMQMSHQQKAAPAQQEKVVAGPQRIETNDEDLEEVVVDISESNEAVKKPVAKPAAKPVAKSQPKPAPAPVAKPQPKPAVKPVAKAPPKPVAKPAPAPVAKAPAKPAPAPVAKPQPKPAPVAKAPAKPAPAPVAKPQPKAAPAPVAKPEPKVAPAPKEVAKQVEAAPVKKPELPAPPPAPVAKQDAPPEPPRAPNAVEESKVEKPKAEPEKDLHVEEASEADFDY